MNSDHPNFQNIGLIVWYDHDHFGFGQVIQDTLEQLDYRVSPFCFDEPIPSGVDLLFSFGPFGPQIGRYLPVPQQLARLSRSKRPLYIHWNTELLPHPQTPHLVLITVGEFRSWVDRLADSPLPWLRKSARRPPISWITSRLHRFRRLGDYRYARRIVGIDLLVESSQVYAQLFQRQGFPAIYVPWGTAQAWYQDLDLPRDIDVLWMGRRGGRRRSNLLDTIRAELEANDIQMYVADNEEHPAIIGEERTRFLNRSKISLNLEPTHYDNAFPYRFHTIAGNRCLVVSELIYPHCSVYQSGVHYVSAPPGDLASTILYYLKNEDERQRIADAAYHLVTEELTFANSVRSILVAASQIRSIDP